MNTVEISTNSSDDSYVVEEIIRHRYVNGKKQYFVKWKDYPHSENTWEPPENFMGPELINRYEMKLKKMETTMTKINSICDDEDGVKSIDAKPKGSEQQQSAHVPTSERRRSEFLNMELEQFIDIKRGRYNRKLYCLVKLKDIPDATYVSMKVARQMFPQAIIAFYEQHLYWTTENGLEKANL